MNGWMDEQIHRWVGEEQVGVDGRMITEWTHNR